MSMMSIISVVVSLAMMLTGAGAAGATAEVSRTLTISDVALSYNGETLALDPTVRMGVSTDGEKALFDFGVDANGEALFPMQLLANADGITALFANSNQAVTVPAEALDALTAQAQQALAGQMEADPQSAQMLSFLKDEFIPAYIGVLQLAQDEARQAAIQEKAKALYGDFIDRGEGTPDTVEIDGATYDVTRYHYIIDSAQLFALTDALYTCDEALQAYYDALMKLYDMLPEESGLNGIASFSDVAAKMGLDMTMDVDEALNEAEGLDVMDAMVTFDVSKVVAAAMEAEAGNAAEGDAAEAPAIEPVTMILHSSQLGDAANAHVTMDYTADGASVAFDCLADDNADGKALSMTMEVAENGEEAGRFSIYAFENPADDIEGTRYGLNLTLEVPEEDAIVSFMYNGAKGSDGSGEDRLDASLFIGGESVISGYAVADSAADGSGTLEALLQGGAEGSELSIAVNGSKAADGTGSADVNLTYGDAETSAGLSFKLAVTDDAIADLSGGAEVTVIDDLSQEGIGKLMNDQGLQGKAMQVAGSFMADAQKLMADESVAKLAGLFTADAGEPADAAALDGSETAATQPGAEDVVVDDLDDDMVIELDDDELSGLDFDEEVEDDGVLPYDEPQLTWLPEGWQVSDSNVDTAYDMADITASDESGDNTLYAAFYSDPEEMDHYAMDAEGALTPLEGRVVNIGRPEPGSWTVNMSEDGVFTALYIYSDTVTLEEIGRIVAGVKY